MLGRRIRSDLETIPTVTNKLVRHDVGVPGVKQSPPSGLVFSAERYAAHKQTHSIGHPLPTFHREVQAPSVMASSTGPDGLNKEIKAPSERNIVADTEFRYCLIGFVKSF